MKHFHKQRLLKLRVLLLKDARRKKGVKFDLTSWGFTGELLARGQARVIPLSCNTYACATGLAALSGEFRGFTYRRIEGGNHIEPVYKRWAGWDAVRKFFGLSPEEANILFDSEEYFNPEGAVAERSVAKRIKAFVEGKQGWERVR